MSQHDLQSLPTSMQAELAVREVEASWAAAYQRSHADRLLRALDCYEHAFMFVHAELPHWAVQHVNEAAIEMTGEAKTKARWRRQLLVWK